jgi:hypothetical protein
MAGLDFSTAISRLRESIAAIPEVAEAIRRNDLEEAAACFDRVAEVEAEAFTELSKIVGATGLPTAG